jgi:SAM-dependent methyltransferase
MRVDYDHSLNLHTVRGAKIALERFFGNTPPGTLLDVGCGTGTWLRAALDLGVKNIYGIDGIEVAEDYLLVPRRCIQVKDLSRRVYLDRKFDVVLCMEVAEHMPADGAPRLIETLVAHSDMILFSAAAPGQQGQHHVNCQWPRYWQELFNAHGYVCDDGFRWEIWDLDDIEPWYRQNVFTARHAPGLAGKEPRITAVRHPEMAGVSEEQRIDLIRQIERGSQRISWYFALLPRALTAKLARKLAR